MSERIPMSPFNDQTGISLRPATHCDFARMTRWMIDECDWELCVEDFFVYQAYLPPESFWAAENERRETVGFISSVKHDENDGFIGCYVVRKDYRGRGVGKLLFDRATEVLAGRNVVLCAEPFMVKKYERQGFGICSDYNLAVSNGKLDQRLLSKDYEVDGVELRDPIDMAGSLRSVIEYDRTVAGRYRGDWLRHQLFTHPVNASLIAVDRLQGRVLGYGSVCDVGRGRLKVGPLYADTPEIARLLTANLLAENVDDEQLYDLRLLCLCPDPKRRQNVLSDFLNLSLPWPVAHLSTQTAPQFDKSKVYCMSDLEVNLV